MGTAGCPGRTLGCSINVPITAGCSASMRVRRSSPRCRRSQPRTASSAEAPGTPVCGATDVCTQRLNGQLTTPVKLSIAVVPKTTGPAVPAGAIQTDADGQTFVLLENSSRRDVQVVATADGLTVVRGLNAGDIVRLSGPAAQGTASG